MSQLLPWCFWNIDVRECSHQETCIQSWFSSSYKVVKDFRSLIFRLSSWLWRYTELSLDIFMIGSWNFSIASYCNLSHSFPSSLLVYPHFLSTILSSYLIYLSLFTRMTCSLSPSNSAWLQLPRKSCLLQESNLACEPLPLWHRCSGLHSDELD